MGSSFVGKDQKLDTASLVDPRETIHFCSAPNDLRRSSGCFIRTKIFERSKHLTNDSFTIRCDVSITAHVAVVGEEAVPSAAAVVMPPPDDIRKHLGSLLLSNEGADVTFQIGAETFVAHRCGPVRRIQGRAIRPHEGRYCHRRRHSPTRHGTPTVQASAWFPLQRLGSGDRRGRG
jgi:hypothetical protein